MSNRFRSSRFDRSPSYGQDYIKNIEQSYAGFGEAVSGFGEQYSALKAQEAKAKALVPDADFTSDAGPNSAFATDAQKLKQKIDGGVEGSYNFLNAAEIERFNSDVAALKKEMNEFEPIYNEAVTNLQKLSLEHDLFVKVGEDPRQAASQKVDGREFYNKKASTKVFDDVMRMADALRYGEVITDDSGKVTVTDQNGETIADYPSRTDYLKAIVELGKPDFQPIPATDGGELVEEKNWATEFKTPTKAEGGFLNFVLNNPELAERRRREKLGLTESEPEGLEMSDEVRDLFERHPITTKNFEGMSQAQYDYVQEMMEGWRARQGVDKPKATSASSSSKKLDTFVGQIGGGNLTINTGLGDLEESVGGTSGLVVRGKVGLDGGKEGSLKKIIYNPNAQESGGSGFSVVIFDGQEDIVMPFDPKPGDQAKDAIAAAIGLSQEDMLKLLKEIKIAGE